MSKIYLDKYYTPIDKAKYCIDTTYKLLGNEIVEVIEPSAGNGSFSLQIPKCLAFDIEPEHNSIKKQDYLLTNIEYKIGRLIIGNPPFGSRMNLAQKFYKKSVEIADYVAFILPISQLWNTNSLYEFDLIHSEDLGAVVYSDRRLHCCFNVYQRPKSGHLNSRPKNKLNKVSIIRQDSKGYDSIENYDIRMCYWGNGSAGKILERGETYSAEYKIIIDSEFKEVVIDLLKRINWFNELNCIAMLKIQQFHIINVLKKYIHNIS